MKLVKQKNKTSCGVACFAMVMGISYRRAMKMLHPERFWWFSDATTSMGAIMEKLDEMHITCSVGAGNDFHTLQRKAIVIVKINETRHHAVVWCPNSQRILDPWGKDPLTLQYCVDNFICALLIDN